MKLAVIIVAYNDSMCLERCIHSLSISSKKPDKIYIIDNSSTNDVQIFLSEKPEITYHRTNRNLGFCEANNLGLKFAFLSGATHALLLNHDTILDSDCLEVACARSSEEQKPSVLSGKIYFTHERDLLWYAGGDFKPWIGAGVNRGFGMRDDGRFDRDVNVDYVTGCFLMIDMRVYQAIGGLNEKLFMYLDDIEYCLRVKKNGFKILYEPKAVLWHDLGSGATFVQRPAYYLYFSLRNKPLVVNGGVYQSYLIMLTIIFGIAKAIQCMTHANVKNRKRKVVSIFYGVLDGVLFKEKYRKRFPEMFHESKNRDGI